MSAQYVPTPRMTSHEAEYVWRQHLLWSFHNKGFTPQESALQFKRLTIERVHPWLHKAIEASPGDFLLDGPDGA